MDSPDKRGVKEDTISRIAVGTAASDHPGFHGLIPCSMRQHQGDSDSRLGCFLHRLAKDLPGKVDMTWITTLPCRPCVSRSEIFPGCRTMNHMKWISTITVTPVPAPSPSMLSVIPVVKTSDPHPPISLVPTGGVDPEGKHRARFANPPEHALRAIEFQCGVIPVGIHLSPGHR